MARISHHQGGTRGGSGKEAIKPVEVRVEAGRGGGLVGEFNGIVGELVGIGGNWYGTVGKGNKKKSKYKGQAVGIEATILTCVVGSDNWVIG